MPSADNAQGVAGIQVPTYCGFGFKLPSTLGNGNPVANAQSRQAIPEEPGVNTTLMTTKSPILYPTIFPEVFSDCASMNTSMM